MKTRLFTVLLICFFANFLSAQTLVKPAEIKTSLIADYLRGKGYTIVEQQETYVKIANKEKAVLFMDIDSQKKYINMNVNVLLKEGADKDKIDNLLLGINSLAMVKAGYLPNQNSISFQYFFWITNGFTLETLEDAVAEFFLYQGDAYSLDKEKIFSYK
ncbi:MULTISPECIES: hypothetical protein [Chryseobacterium]|uniref:Uncharacterized protein n=1 Tax=Chryseobacterium camelliae TaxID=1265445 RepID=A0ABU0TMK1_9FLAO|nr:MULTISPECIES: hypothetical protein [Chryseobacterium]MDT3407869.1 hypothetical protein [Pseudacidovorax intermedius]MDQ1098276.1 hypothetical protein [Chryseobacterium camelliae]MDQ1102201.1 hypothetical protein [Chryseobacterium sp. SORGH_AS_1048]MDR6085639.1 hypothetical protein [Chryseobacterium sp. SORGH_AS_0909]MDR6130005.1 hypothetical protein [Chryseobacterium sp. SORGH_AS_1175]